MYWNEDENILDIIGSAKERLLDARTFEALLDRGDEVGRSAVEFSPVNEEALWKPSAVMGNPPRLWVAFQPSEDFAQ